MGLGSNLSGSLSSCLLVRACAKGCPQRVELCDWALCSGAGSLIGGGRRDAVSLRSSHLRWSAWARVEGRGVGVGEGLGLPSA